MLWLVAQVGWSPQGADGVMQGQMRWGAGGDRRMDVGGDVRGTVGPRS
jgi:hypothetical protein